jgi:hypothetical protein
VLSAAGTSRSFPTGTSGFVLLFPPSLNLNPESLLFESLTRFPAEGGSPKNFGEGYEFT